MNIDGTYRSFLKEEMTCYTKHVQRPELCRTDTRRVGMSLCKFKEYSSAFEPVPLRAGWPAKRRDW